MSCRPTIAVRDKEDAKVFFGQTLGLSLVDENPVGATFLCGETFLEVYPSPFAGTAKNTVAGFAQLGPNRRAWFRDPDGNTFGLVELGQTT